jgi:hypothetical protein
VEGREQGSLDEKDGDKTTAQGMADAIHTLRIVRPAPESVKVFPGSRERHLASKMGPPHGAAAPGIRANRLAAAPPTRWSRGARRHGASSMEQAHQGIIRAA